MKKQNNLLTLDKKINPPCTLDNQFEDTIKDKALLENIYELSYLQYTRMYLEHKYTVSIDQFNRCSEILELALIDRSIDSELVDKVKDVINKSGIRGFDLLFVYTDVQGALIHLVSMYRPEYSLEEVNMIIDKAYAELIYGSKK